MFSNFCPLEIIVLASTLSEIILAARVENGPLYKGYNFIPAKLMSAKFMSAKGSTSLGAVNLVKMVKITDVPTLSVVLNLIYRMQQKFRRSTVKKGRITLERNPMVDIVSPWSISQLRFRLIRPFLTVNRRNFCCIRKSRFRTIERVGTSVILTIKQNLQLLGRCSLLRYNMCRVRL